MGFRQEQIENCILKLLDKKLIECEGRSRPKCVSELPLSLRITTIGAYHVQSLICQFAYVDAMVTDTPIIDDESRKVIADVVTIDERLSRTNAFCQYLDKQWCKINATGTSFSWPLVHTGLQESMEAIKIRVSFQKEMSGQPRLNFE